MFFLLFMNKLLFSVSTAESVHPDINLSSEIPEYPSNFEIPSEVHENLAQIHSHIHSSDFKNFRFSVESDLDIEHYQHAHHPQMNSMRFSDHFRDYRPSYQYHDDGFYGNFNRNGANRQHRPKPTYPKAYSNSNDHNRFNRRNGVPEDEMNRRTENSKQKKRVLYAGENLNDKMKEIEGKYEMVFFGNEQMMVTYWMEVIRKIFNDSEKKVNNFGVFWELKQEFFNLGIEINDLHLNKLQNSTCEFHILEYEKEIDSEYIPGIKMFVPYIAFNF